jgi:hypothetical protein
MRWAAYILTAVCFAGSLAAALLRLVDPAGGIIAAMIGLGFLLLAVVLESSLAREPRIARVQVEFTPEQRDDLRQLVLGIGTRAMSVSYLAGFTANAKRLVVADPYFFACKNSQIDELKQVLKSVIDLSSARLQTVTVFSDPRHDQTLVVNWYRNEAGGRLRHHPTDRVHDRVWAKDGPEGILVGTSLMGLGRRLAFSLPLPATDLREFLTFLDDEFGLHLRHEMT